ncbi:uncharacterized protein [Musca autumnalis]|uniref:uncharacterized protein n=1 Tax=Musca autumnalis TaxID=221902 RepID=UPI003CF8CF3C
MPGSLRISWAYTLRKEDLVAYLEEFKRSTSGTVDQLRRRFAHFLAEFHEAERLERILELQDLHEKPSSSQAAKSPTPLKIPLISVTSPSSPVSRKASSEKTGQSTLDLPGDCNAHKSPTHPRADANTGRPVRDPRSLADQVRKWNVSYDGTRGPLEFIERLEELALMYEVDMDELPRMMPEVLRDNALVWFRTNNQHWRKWKSFREDFMRFFLPARHFEHLEDEIRRRKQKPRESFKAYTLGMQNLMRHTNYENDQKLERIFRNALPEYQWYIRRRDFHTLGDLLEMAEDLESLPPGTGPVREQHRLLDPGNQSEQDSRIDPKTACRRCGQPNHFAAQCRNPQVLFCWDCGRRGVRTIACCRPVSGNGNRVRQSRGEADPMM